ncbi:MAG: shikimate dehydrogenase [Candidatus Fonsibacter sp.]|nr:shikimate dehydrogenase [Candidatus Fonsibacter sp.]
MKNRKFFLVVGNPIKHSLSPLLHNYWFRKNKINCEYKRLKTTQTGLQNILNKVRKNKIEGINVTIPFKNSIIRHLDFLKGDALKTSSVNTVYLYKKKLIGDNTDVYGFSSGILKKIKTKINTAGIIGAGGVTSSIILALIEKGVKKIYITNRTFSKLKIFKEKFKKTIHPIKWNDRYKVFGDVQILINVTSLGMLGQKDLKFDFSIFDKKINVVDVVYNPENTRLLKDARKNGHKVFTGLDMFIYQAQKAFYIWNKKDPKITKDIYRQLRKKING